MTRGKLALPVGTLLFVLLAACRSTFLAGSLSAPPTLAPTAAPVWQPTITESPATPTQEPEKIVTLAATQPPQPPQGPLPPAATLPAATPALAPGSLEGLVYNDVDKAQVWKFGPDNQARLLLDRYPAVISPNGMQALYEQDGDLWVTDLLTPVMRNLTNHPDRLHAGPQWWPTRPGLVILGSWARAGGALPHYGQLTRANLDGSAYVVLDDTPSLAPPALSPDGGAIAYDRGGRPWIYDLEQGPRAFDLAAYNLPGKDLAAAAPAWSPDGKKLAWWVAGEGISGPGYKQALVVFDLAAKTFALIHPLELQSPPDPWPAPAAFSPDGVWLAYAPAHFGLWLSYTDGYGERSLGHSNQPVWSPDSAHLVYTRWPPDSDSYLAADPQLLTIKELSAVPLDLPDGASPAAWLWTPPGVP